MQRIACSSLLLVACCLFAPPLQADVTLTFETLLEGEILTNQFASLGVTVSGMPMVLTAGSLLNEFDFPPHSGQNVLADLGGPVVFTFYPTGAAFVSGFFTYSLPLTFETFAPDGTPIATEYSAAGKNLEDSEEVVLHGPAGGIGSLRISSGASASFTVDDLTFGLAPSTVPEPSSLLLIVPVAALALRGIRKIRRR